MAAKLRSDNSTMVSMELVLLSLIDCKYRGYRRPTRLIRTGFQGSGSGFNKKDNGLGRVEVSRRDEPPWSSPNLKYDDVQNNSLPSEYTRVYKPRTLQVKTEARVVTYRTAQCSFVSG